ncbi:MAG: DUF488 family protein [Candidatus Omnitrophica bacterium]|nr:DUF488 family protein [Candidatus Omnitrophota bacterium]MDE2009871.1 DUF488 family protein [Candidatus Omnitrophota bacterium]MDE2214347.1 DUF488 family protein [Candidatus Omnitrophota bacterium]MDE2231096.1 DUF488 family protein [Candidatus Omnitrophota bacterium]
MKLKIKRIYEPPEKSDGFRILVDRLWPRGISKKRAAVDVWLKDIAPTSGLREWFGHDPDRWDEFRHKYTRELKKNKTTVGQIKKFIDENDIVTLVFSAKDVMRNQASVLKRFLNK